LEDLFYLPLSRSDLNRTIFNICFWLWATWIITTACARMHNLLLRRDQRGAEIQSPGDAGQAAS